LLYLSLLFSLANSNMNTLATHNTSSENITDIHVVQWSIDGSVQEMSTMVTPLNNEKNIQERPQTRVRYAATSIRLCASLHMPITGLPIAVPTFSSPTTFVAWLIDSPIESAKSDRENSSAMYPSILMKAHRIDCDHEESGEPKGWINLISWLLWPMRSRHLQHQTQQSLYHLQGSFYLETIETRQPYSVCTEILFQSQRVNLE
ncbi:hypothetical protein KCU89_g22, partial [Aureobasidium melanogenum]